MNEWRELLAKRRRTSKTKRLYIDDQPTNKHSLDAIVGTSLHYEEVEGSGDWQEVDPRIVLSAEPGWDWEMAKSHWRFLVRNGGWFAAEKKGVGIGFRLDRIAYLNIVTKDWQTINTASYGTPTVTGEPTGNDLLPNPRGKLTWTGVFPDVDFEIHTGGDTLREQVVVSTAARAAMPSPPYPAADTYLVMVYEVDWGQVPGLSDDSVDIDPDTDFERDGRLYLKDSLDAITAVLPASEAWAELDTTARVHLRKRFVHVAGQHYLLVGAPILDLNALPAGGIVFDPTIDETIGASSDDAWEYNPPGNPNITDPDETLDPDYEVGFRWTSVGVPGGATIDVAYQEIYCETGARDDAALDIHAENANNPGTFTVANGNLSTRTKTTAKADWDAATGGFAYVQSPSLVAVVQEVVDDQVGTGDAFILLWVCDVGCNFDISFYDLGPGTRPSTLHIEYTPGAVGGGVKDTMLFGLL